MHTVRMQDRQQWRAGEAPARLVEKKGHLMAKAAFDKIMAGVNDAIAYVDGSADKASYGIHTLSPPDVKAIRAKTGLSQAKFAHVFALH